MTRRFALLLVCILFVTSRASADEAWFVVSFSGTPVGLAKDVLRREGDGYFYEGYLELKATRMGSPFTLVFHVQEWDDADGRPVRFRSGITINGMSMETSGELQGDEVRIRSENQGFVQEDSIRWEVGAIGQGSLDRMTRQRLESGERDFTFRVFDGTAGSFRTSRFHVGERTEVVVRGRKQELNVVQQFDDGSESPSATYWVDDEWDPRKISMQQLGITITMERVEPEEIDELELDPNFDVIRASMIPCPGFPGDIASLESVTYALVFDGPTPDVSALEGPNQSVVSSSGSTLNLLVSRDVVNDQTISDGERETYLSPGRFIQSDHPEIRAIADSIAAGGGTGMDLAVELAEWVSWYIVEKTFSQGFGSALDALYSREGDCTEHSVLLASVLRASGFPARVASGLAYSNGQLVGHMWTEVYVDRWVTLDALDLSTAPIRIRLSVSRNQRALGETDTANAYSLVAGMKASVRSHRPGP